MRMKVNGELADIAQWLKMIKESRKHQSKVQVNSSWVSPVKKGSNDMGVDLRVCFFIWHQNDWQPSHGSWFDHICTSFWRMGGSFNG